MFLLGEILPSKDTELSDKKQEAILKPAARELYNL